jgi:hypothetical protein
MGSTTFLAQYPRPTPTTERQIKKLLCQFEITARVQGNILSLAKMGLVAIPNKDIVVQDKVDDDD